MHVKPSNNTTSAEDLCFKSISKEGVYRLNVVSERLGKSASLKGATLQHCQCFNPFSIISLF